MKIRKLPKDKLDFFAAVVQQFGEVHAPVEQDGRYVFKRLARWSDARLDYEREVDRDTRNFVSERMAFSATLRPLFGWSLTGGADYDLARGLWGSADLSLPASLFQATVDVAFVSLIVFATGIFDSVFSFIVPSSTDSPMSLRIDPVTFSPSCLSTRVEGI